MMNVFFVVALLVFVTACGSSPTAPTPPPIVNVPVTPPVVVIPPPVVPPTFPPADPRFDLAFYRRLAHNAHDGPTLPLARQLGPPNIYLFSVDDTGAPIDAVTLDVTAAALINVTGSLTGVFGLASLQTGPGPAPPAENPIFVYWSSDTNAGVCGRGAVGGRIMYLYPKTPRCRCDGNPAIVNPRTVKHELGHVLGFWHTDGRDDLMFHQNSGACDQNPTAREMYHAAVAYTQPLGSPAP